MTANSVTIEEFTRKQKLMIAEAIIKAAKEQGLSIRELAKKAGLLHPQVYRVTSCKNYTRDTLFRILDSLDLTIEIVARANDQ